jgi:hypothetical protein
MDTTVTISLSPFYLLNSLEIWGVTFLLVPMALLQKRTYTDILIINLLHGL